MGRPKKIVTSLEEKVEVPVKNEPVTYKQELENLYKEMQKLGIHSIGQLEVIISQQK